MTNEGTATHARPAKRIRTGLYEYRGHTIECLDERAERDTTDLDYGFWRVIDERKMMWQTWDAHFHTLRAAKRAIDAELQSEQTQADADHAAARKIGNRRP